MSFHNAPWEKIQALRQSLDEQTRLANSLQQAAQTFATMFATSFTSCALARVFALVPLEALPRDEQSWARNFAMSVGRGEKVTPQTSVLSLVGTAGVERSWNLRTESKGHRAIPLVDQAFVESAPMIASLLDSLQIDPTQRSSEGELQIRSMAGGLNARFFVSDADTALNADGRHIIAAREFVTNHKIKSVFGMGGTYVTGAITIAIVFTTEALTVLDVDRFTTFIGTFKMATSECVERGRLFA